LRSGCQTVLSGPQSADYLNVGGASCSIMIVVKLDEQTRYVRVCIGRAIEAVCLAQALSDAAQRRGHVRRAIFFGPIHDATTPKRHNIDLNW
jgi:hypothetical protein